MSPPSCLRCRTQTVNTVEAIWMKSPSEVEDEKYDEFYQFIAKAFDKPLAKVGTPVCVLPTSCISICCTLRAWCVGLGFLGDTGRGGWSADKLAFFLLGDVVVLPLQAKREKIV